MVRPPYYWPATLRRPTSQRLVYLDLNHWVAVAKVLSRHRDRGKHHDAVHHCSLSVQQQHAVFPISLQIYVEVLKINNRRRRTDIKKAIEHLGRFFVVTNRHVIVTHEIEALLDNLVGPNPDPVNSMNYLDWSIFRALGMHGGVRVLDEQGEDVTSLARSQFTAGPDEFDRMLEEGILELNRQILDGRRRRAGCAISCRGIPARAHFEELPGRSCRRKRLGALARPRASMAQRKTARCCLST